MTFPASIRVKRSFYQFKSVSQTWSVSQAWSAQLFIFPHNALKEWFLFFVFCVLYSKNKLISNCKKFMIRDQKDLLNRVHSFLSSATSIQITLLTLYGFNNYHKTSYSLNISYLNIKIGKEIQWKTKLLVQCSNFHLIERIQVNLQLLFKYKII